VRAVDRQEDWIAAALGIGMIPVGAELTGYYYAVLLGLGLLWVHREEVGAALCGLSALSWLFVEIWHWTDQVLTWTSLAAVVFVVFATLRVPSSGLFTFRSCRSRVRSSGRASPSRRA
jgi:hypothetical protein